MKLLFEINEKYLPTNGDANRIIWNKDTNKVLQAQDYYIPDDIDRVLIVKDPELGDDQVILVAPHERELFLLDLVGDTMQVEVSQKAQTIYKRFGITPSAYCMVTKGTRPMTRDMAINCLFSYDRLPTVDDANHLLTELRQPGLFTNTKSYGRENHVNERNYVIKCVLGWANAIQQEWADEILPRNVSWIGFLQTVLDAAGFQRTLREKANVYVPDMGDFSPDVQRLIEDLSERAKKITSNQTHLRQAAVERYRMAQGLKNSTQVHQRCMNRIYLTEEHTRKLLSDGERGARDSLILACAFLGCSINEVNQILQQANYALLYPRSMAREERDFLQLF